MKDTQYSSRSQELWQSWDRTFRRSLVAAVVLHVLVVWLFREVHPVPDLDYSAAGEHADDARAAAGGGMELITLVEARAPEPEPEPEVAIPVPVPEPVPVPVPPPEEPRPAPAQQPGRTASAGEGRGQDAGPGTEAGTSAGAGGTSESGAGSTSAPTPRGLILPPSDRPNSVRGKTVTVYVFVDVRGTVVRDSTRLNPTSGDSRFDNRLKQQAAEWRFRPATQAGQPVPSWFPYTITF
jgi:outer membrane biosynthesis protein TonB